MRRGRGADARGPRSNGKHGFYAAVQQKTGAARFTKMLKADNDCAHPLALRFADFVREAEFPCVGAKAALQRGGMRFVVGRDFRSAWDDLRIMPALLQIARDYVADPRPFQSLAVLFEGGAPDNEAGFETLLWERLQSLTDKDQWLGQIADPRVKHDPEDPHFAMSFGGQGFFVVGLHPTASRPARRFAAPALVFNLHDQFEQLRAQQRYEPLRAKILERDLALAGSVNPMLARHGQISSARQYSGRAVDESWACPFSGRSSEGDDKSGTDGHRDAA